MLYQLNYARHRYAELICRNLGFLASSFVAFAPLPRSHGPASVRLRADVAELVDALGLGPSAARREGSSPFIRTRVYIKVLIHNTSPL